MADSNCLTCYHPRRDHREGHCLDPDTGKPSADAYRKPCAGCGGPDDHYPDCLPASQGGTQPDVVRL